MVAAKAGRTMVGAVRAAAASAAEPETKRRLCKIFLLGAGPFLGGRGSGLAARLLDTGNVANLPVRQGRGPRGLSRKRRKQTRGKTLISANVPTVRPIHDRPPGLDGVDADGIGIGGLCVHESGTRPSLERFGIVLDAENARKQRETAG